MTGPTPAAGPESGPTPWWRRPAVRYGALGAAVVAVVLLGVQLTGAGDDPAAPASPAASASAPSAEPTDPPTDPAPTPTEPGATGEPTTAPDEPTAPADEAPVPAPAYTPAAEPAVPIDEPAAFDTGVTARIASLEAVQGEAVGPGEVGGPALRVTVELTNGTSAEVSLDTSVVDLYSGPAADPASPLSGSGFDPFGGSLAPGATATAVYVFGVPADQRDRVLVTVSYTPGSPMVVFEGAAPAA